MSRQQFTSRNNIGQILTFQKSGSTASFDPSISFVGSIVSWRTNNGVTTTQTAGNTLTYTGFTSDTGIRTIEIRGIYGLRNMSSLDFQNDNIYGNLNLNSISNLTGSGSFTVQNNLNLTGITHSPSSVSFSQYIASSCNLTGNLDLTPLSGLGGTFIVQNNPLLTGITHSVSSQNFTSYFANNCNLTGNLDLTPLSGFGGSFLVETNANLTGITHTLSSNNVSQYLAGDCDLTGTIDLTPLTKLGLANSGTTGIIRFNGNNNLTNILLPTSTQFFKNGNNSVGGKIFNLYDCDLGYVDFTPLSGATLLSGVTVGPAGIELQNNNMVTADVNHILVDFSGNATYNPTGWSNVNLNISGTNGAPDSSSGGYDGISAISFLTGSPYNWTITYT